MTHSNAGTLRSKTGILTASENCMSAKLDRNISTVHWPMAKCPRMFICDEFTITRLAWNGCSNLSFRVCNGPSRCSKNPGEVLDPVFHFLDDAIADYGVYLYLVMVWLSVIVIAWIFSGGLRRKMRQQPRISVGIVIQASAPPQPLFVYPDSVC